MSHFTVVHTKNLLRFLSFIDSPIRASRLPGGTYFPGPAGAAAADAPVAAAGGPPVVGVAGDFSSSPTPGRSFNKPILSL